MRTDTVSRRRQIENLVYCAGRISGAVCTIDMTRDQISNGRVRSETGKSRCEERRDGLNGLKR